MASSNFMGLDGFVWFTGVVEDRNDPAKLGRVRVRCLGFHTEDKNDIPTADLPWAHVMPEYNIFRVSCASSLSRPSCSITLF